VLFVGGEVSDRSKNTKREARLSKFAGAKSFTFLMEQGRHLSASRRPKKLRAVTLGGKMSPIFTGETFRVLH
jgi:hypothetical protein